MIVCPETSEDFRKYYSGTYIVVPEAVPDEVAYVSSVGAHSCVLKYQNDQKAEIIYDTVGYEVKSPLTLQKQYFLLSEGSPAFIERIPARKWKKGIASTNTRLTTPSEIPIDLTYAHLNAFLQNKDKVSTSEEVVTHRAGVLDPNWAVYQEFVYLKGFKVGKFNARRKVIMLGKQFVPLFPKSFSNEWRVISA